MAEGRPHVHMKELVGIEEGMIEVEKRGAIWRTRVVSP
jgi:hypothetical protein